MNAAQSDNADKRFTSWSDKIEINWFCTFFLSNMTFAFLKLSVEFECYWLFPNITKQNLIFTMDFEHLKNLENVAVKDCLYKYCEFKWQIALKIGK